MLVLRLERWPDGDHTRAEIIGHASIVNDNDDGKGNYWVTVYHGGIRVGEKRIIGHQRGGDIWVLVAKALRGLRQVMPSVD